MLQRNERFIEEMKGERFQYWISKPFTGQTNLCFSWKNIFVNQISDQNHFKKLDVWERMSSLNVEESQYKYKVHLGLFIYMLRIFIEQ